VCAESVNEIFRGFVDDGDGSVGGEEVKEGREGVFGGLLTAASVCATALKGVQEVLDDGGGVIGF
jgi:hypothetical protein